jgi:hypothetical protein
MKKNYSKGKLFKSGQTDEKNYMNEEANRTEKYAIWSFFLHKVFPPHGAGYALVPIVHSMTN